MNLVAVYKLRYSFAFSQFRVDWIISNQLSRQLDCAKLEYKRLWMSVKESFALGQLLSLLEARYAMRVLWALRDGRGQTFRLLQDSVGNITPNTLNTRLKELREAGLLAHGSDGYIVTAMGADLLHRLSDLPMFATKWVNTQTKTIT